MKSLRMIIFLILITTAYAKTPIKNYLRLNDGIVVNLQQGKIKLQLRSENIIRVTYSPTDSFPKQESLMIVKNEWKLGNWDLKETEQTLSMITQKMNIKFDFKTGAVTFLDRDRNTLLKETQQNSRELIPAIVSGEQTLLNRIKLFIILGVK